MSVNKDGRAEDALKNALRRREAPGGFADGVLARVAEKSSGPIARHQESWVRLFAQPLVRWAAAAAVCVAVVAGGAYYRQVQRERAEGKAAKQQLVLALRIAGSKLQLAKSKVQSIQADQTENQGEKE